MIILLVTSIARRGAARCRKLIKVSLPLSFVSRRTTWTLKLGSLRHVPRRCSAGLKPITRPLAWTHLHASRTVIPVLMPVYRPLSIGRRSRVSKYCSADIDRLTPTIMLDRSIFFGRSGLRFNCRRGTIVLSICVQELHGIVFVQQSCWIETEWTG